MSATVAPPALTLYREPESAGTALGSAHSGEGGIGRAVVTWAIYALVVVATRGPAREPVLGRTHTTTIARVTAFENHPAAMIIVTILRS